MIRFLPHHTLSKFFGKSLFISAKFLVLFPCRRLSREVLVGHSWKTAKQSTASEDLWGRVSCRLGGGNYGIA